MIGATETAALADHAAAMVEHARAFERDPEDRAPLEALATMFADLGRWLGAAAALEMSRRGEPPAEVALALDLVMITLVQRIAGSFPGPGVSADADAAVASLLDRTADRPARLQLAAARALVDVGRTGDAAAILDRLPAELAAVDRGHLHYLEGLLAERADQPARALDHYAVALASDPDRADAAVNATSLCLAEGNLAELAEILGRASPAARAHPALLFNESIYLLRVDDAPAARARLGQLLAASSDPRLTALARQALAALG
jgi:tetratricopeptide (TPR) repeat protein